jgi:hypothetical protein
MIARLRTHLTYANVMASVAVFIALGAGAYAAGLAPDSVKSKHIKDGQVKSVDVLDDGLTGDDVMNGSLGAGELAPGTLSPLRVFTGTAVAVASPGVAALGPIVVVEAGQALVTYQVEQDGQQNPTALDCSNVMADRSAQGDTIHLPDFEIPGTTERSIGSTTATLNGGGEGETLVFSATCTVSGSVGQIVSLTPSVSVVD